MSSQKNKNKKIKYIVGIDEAGRGPLAGPLSISAVCLPKEHLFLKQKIKDSKKLSPTKRKEWMNTLNTRKKLKEINWEHVFVSAKVIDKKGLSFVIKSSIVTLLRRLNLNANNVEVRLDGGLKAPGHFLYQRTIIKGDERESVIALASIIAKVRRDIYMEKIAQKFPAYKFEIHKGYGTHLHRQKIRTYGPSAIHRKTFLRSILTSVKK